MYLWKIDKLKEELRQGSLSEKESFKYLLAWEILYSLVLIPFPVEWSVLDVYDGLLELVLAILGIAYVYKVNGGSAGKYFLQRYLSIGWVVFVRFSVFVTIPVIIAYGVVYGVATNGADMPEQTTWLDIALLGLVSMAYYLISARHMKAITEEEASVQLAER